MTGGAMRVVQMIGISIFTILSTASYGDIEKCSIKEESSCSGSLHPEDKSYTFSLGTQLDAELVLNNQLRIYKELRDRFHSERYFPIYVELKSDQNYHDFVSAKLLEFVKKHDDCKFLKDIDVDNLYLSVRLLPSILRNRIVNEVPISRFAIPNEAYSEKILLLLKKAFPGEITTSESLSEEQKTLVVKYGALAILSAQGFAKRVRLKGSVD